MKPHIHISCLLVSAWILSGCATTANVPNVALSPERTAGLMAINDNLIVPGERIGPVFLGMTEQQLYKKLGDPMSTNTAPGTVNYSYPKLQVCVDAIAHTVWEIDTKDGQYSTAEGIKIGSSTLAVRTQLVGSHRERFLPPEITFSDFASGLTADLRPEVGVFGLSVWIPGHFHY